MSTKKDFSGKVVLVTGSSSGIGAGTAEEFAKAGAQIVITGRNADNLAEIGRKCLKASPNGLKPLEIVAEISKEEDCKRLIDSTIEKFGRLDVLVNNAGVAIPYSLEDSKILKIFDDLININLRSVVYLTHLSVKHLEKTKGNIVNVSSCLGIKPRTTMGLYCMSKSALNMFTQCTALELGPKGIRVNIVSPAVVRTNLGRDFGLTEEKVNAMLVERAKEYPLGRIGEPLDIANAILFLASDECSWITGINFIADGGYINAPSTSR